MPECIIPPQATGDFRKLDALKQEQKSGEAGFDFYIEFATQFASFADHPFNPRPIKERNFRI